MPRPPKSRMDTKAQHRAITTPSEGMSSKEARAAVNAMKPNTLPDGEASSVVCATFRNESGSGGVGGTITYCRRPSQRMAVDKNISAPGMPNAIAGPKFFRKTGMSSDAKNEPKLMIQ